MHRLFVQEALKRQRNFGLATAIRSVGIEPPNDAVLQHLCSNDVAKFLESALPAKGKFNK